MSDDPKSGWYQQDDSPEPEQPSDRGDRKRFWLSADKGKNKVTICFVDDVPFRIYEHDAKIAGHWGNRFTCTQGAGPEYEPCPGCYFVPRNEKPNRYRIGYVTILVETPFTAKDGTEVKNYRRLFPMKGKLLKRFLTYKEDRGGSLVGTRWRLWRTGPKAHNVGDDWSYLDRIPGIEPHTDPTEARKIIAKHYDLKDRDDVPIPEVDPFDYFEMMQPQSPDTINALLGVQSGETQSEDRPEEAAGAPTGSQVDYS